MTNVMTKAKLNNVIANIKREKLASIANIVSMTITFFVLGIFISIVFLTRTAIKNLEQRAQVTIFFKDDFAEPNILDLKTKLQGDTRILEVAYISKQDALKIFMDINKDEPILLESISADILPASLEIKTKKIDDLKVIAEEYQSVDGVEEIKYFKDVIDKFNFWSTRIYVLGLVLLTLLILTSFTIVLTTIRVTINSKGTELEILKLVGASDSYVKDPLIYQGVFFGLVSALVSSVVIFALFLTLQALRILDSGSNLYLAFNVRIAYLIFPLILTAILILSGVLLGYIGSSTAIKRYLKY